MKTIVTDRLTHDYLQRLRRQNYIATTIVVVITISCVFWSLFHIGGDKGANLLSNVMYPLTSAIGACWAFMTAYRSRSGPLRLRSHFQLAWLLIGLGLLANCLGGVDYTYLAMIGILNPVPSASDIGFTFFYLFAFMGLLVMPSNLQFRKRFALDALITTLCLLGISWFFFISTIFFANRDAHESLETLIVTLSYPFWDILLILPIALLIQRRTEPILHTSLGILAGGVLCQIWADTGYAYTLAINIYSTGTVYIDPFWFLGFLLFGLSALYQYSMLARRAYNERSYPVQLAISTNAQTPKGQAKPRTAFISLQSALIYLPFIFLLVLTLYSDIIKNESTAFFLVVLTAIVGMLITARYLLATRENEILLEERERGRQEAEQLYQQLRIAHQQLQELDQLKDQFMITASHELRTPLTAVQGYIELLAQYEDFLPGEQRREFLQKAQRSCDELVVLLRNVMDASRLEIEAGIRTSQMEPVLVEEVVDSVLNLIEPQLTQEQREVHLSIPAQLRVQADSGRLLQVLLNLSVNALKYSPPQTPITFSAQSFSKKDRYVIMSITDKGKGIASQDQARLFERFVRLDSDINSPVRGSGLGLYISRRLIEAMNGRIWIESSGIPGEGSTFHIELPAG